MPQSLTITQRALKPAGTWYFTVSILLALGLFALVRLGLLPNNNPFRNPMLPVMPTAHHQADHTQHQEHSPKSCFGCKAGTAYQALGLVSSSRKIYWPKFASGHPTLQIVNVEEVVHIIGNSSEAKQNCMSGTVQVKVLFGSNGNYLTHKVVSGCSVANPALTKAVSEHIHVVRIKKMTADPFSADFTSGPMWVTIPFKFKPAAQP